MNLDLNYLYYPVLSPNARLTKMKDCCVLIDRIYGSYVLLEPHMAVIVAMCNGALSLERLINISQEFLPVSRKEATKITLKTIEKANDYVYWNETPEKLEWKYNPADFLYEAKKQPKDTLLPLEKPIQMTIVLTNECNYECIYCFRSAKDKWENELTKEELFNLIDQAAELNIKYCSLTGGEPTLSPYFEEVVLKLLEKDIYPYISSNGTNITDTTLEKFKLAGLQTIQFSIDSARPEIFDKMVGAKGTFDKLIAAIQKSVELGFVVRVKGVLTEINAPYIDHLFKTCADLKVDYVFLEPFSPGLDGRGNKNLLLTPKTAQEIEKTIEKATKEYAPDTIIMPFNTPSKWADPNDIIYCGGMYTSFIVQSDGTVGACEQASDPQLNFGNIRDHTIKEIWSSQEVIRFLNPNKSKLQEPCKTCEDFDKCRSGCFNYSLQYSQDLFAPDPRCWKANLGELNPLKL